MSTASPLSSLPRPSSEFPRYFLPVDLDFSKWENLEPFGKQLMDASWKNQESFTIWFNQYAEFENAVLEEGSRLYIAMTCDTQNKEKEKQYLHFVEHLEPKLETLHNHIHKRLTQELPLEWVPKEHLEWISSVQRQLKLFREKNLPIQSEVAKLSQEYQKRVGSLTVLWEENGTQTEKTLTQLSPKLQVANREEREEAWTAIQSRRHQDKNWFDQNFEDLFVHRHAIAQECGFENYRDYAFEKYNRQDYTPKDCELFHKTVEQVVVPRYKAILEDRKKKLGVETLRPWDLECDIYNRPALTPYKETKDLVEGVQNIFSKMDSELGSFFEKMRNKKLLDLENRIGKAPGGYQCTLDEVRYPFIFMNAVKSNGDVFTLLHEAGHSFHAFYSRSKVLPALREAPMEFCEVASMTMERWGMDYLEEFYTSEDKNRAIVSENEGVFQLLLWIACVDSFQHWMYTHPRHTRKERTQKWSAIMEKYNCGVDWSGLEEYRDAYWHKQLHIFEYPFYYIEYGIAQMGALQFWQQAKKDSVKAMKHYKTSLKKGGTLGLRHLFEAAGLQLDFTPETFEPILKELYEEWEALS
jgi:oligoendopeptidase F